MSNWYRDIQNKILEARKFEMPSILYHGTWYSRLDSIKEHGLIPSKSQSSLLAVFLAYDEYTAQNYEFMNDSDVPNDTWVVLKIDLSRLDQSKLGPDNYELPDMLEQLPPRDPCYGKEWDECSWQDSLRICAQCAYYGVISPDSINDISNQLFESNEDDRIFISYCNKNNIKISNLSDEELKQHYNKAIANKDAYPIMRNDTRYLYHATAKKYLPSIVKNGLIPSEKPNGKSHIKHSLGRVFFTNNIENASFYGSRTAGASSIVLRVLRSNLRDAIPDSEDKDSVFVSRYVPSTQIEIWNGEQWERLG